MISESNPYENPKMAIIRLLKSQGCCPCESQPKNSLHSEELQEVLSYKEQLKMKVAVQRQKLKQIPCVITLAQEIQQLRDVINGLVGENRQRMEYLHNTENNKCTVSTGWEITEQEDKAQHDLLQAEYSDLLRTLENTNSANQRLVQKMTFY